jgi:hypothetical protein
MTLAFGLTQDYQDVEWFDTYDEAIDAHQKKSHKWDWAIVVYGYAQRLCTVIYHPPTGYWPSGFVNAEGVDLLEKYNVKQEIFGEQI